MFVLTPKPTFKADVTIPVAGGKGGKITFIFKHKGKKDLRTFFEDLGKEENAGRSDVDALLELVEGWEGVDQPFSEDNFELLLDAYPGAVMALLETYRKELTEGRAKN